MNKFPMIFAGIAMLICSCTKEVAQDALTCQDVDSSLDGFARSLSKALYLDSSMREFVRNEALKQYDNDYDVFYPFIKDKKVRDERTFEEILIEYCPECDINGILNNHPFLNILVPDWEWLGAFSVKSWDVSSNDIFVGIADNVVSHSLYRDGKIFGELEEGEIPDFPVVIIKDNERMIRKTSKTKAELDEYDFADPAFDNIGTKVAAEETYRHYPVNPGSDIISKQEMQMYAKEAVAAWQEYGDDTFAAQRKYIYFGCKKGEDIGLFNPKMRESIYAVKLHDVNVIEEEDPHLQNAKRKRTDLTDAEILSKIWSEGNLEIKFHVSVIDDKGEAVDLLDNTLSIKPSDLFDISQIKRKFYHKTAFSPREYIYIPNKNDLVSKWYYLPTPLFFDRWIPSSQSDVISAYIYEEDKSKLTTVEERITKKYSIKPEIEIAGKFKFSFDFSSPETTITEKYEINEGSDNLGNAKIYFDDYVIKSETSTGYQLNSYYTGQFSFIVVPMIH